MAASREGQRLTEEHRQTQVAVQQAFLAEFVALWALLDGERLDDTAPGWLRAVMRLLGAFRQQSADTAVDYYERLRLVEAPAAQVPPPRVVFQAAPRVAAGRPAQRGNRGRRIDPFPASERVERGEVPLRQLDPDRQVPLRISWGDDDRAARSSLIVTGPVGIKNRTGRGQGVQVRNRAALVEASGAASRHVLNGGRKTLLTVLDADTPALGWQRVGDGDPCAFCAMLISRGPVYGSQVSASFEAHDHCGCTAEPVFTRDGEWPGRAREFQQLWNAHIRGRYSGKEAIREWRRLYERLRRERQTVAA